jgi:urease accessory protein
VAHWNGWLDAARESGELQAEDRHLAHALARLLSALGVEAARAWVAPAPACFATVFALAATHWAVPLRPAALGLLWTWAENQVAAATKLVPLGQTAAQRLLSAVIARLPAVVDRGLALADDDIGSGAPAWALASALHETQYTRLFRS